MSIDWLTVSAQLLNFLILVWLLKRFLYRPILDGIDAREQEIVQRMGEAASIKADALGKQVEYERQIDSLEKQSSDTLAQAKATAERVRDSMLNDVRTRIESEQRALHNQRQQQAQQFIHELNNQGGNVLLSMTQKVLKDLSDETLEERLVLHAINIFHQDCAELSLDSDTSDIALVNTQNPLSDKCKTRIEASTQADWPAITLTFTNNPRQSPGALIQLGSKQIDWTIDSYFHDLENTLTQQLLRDVELTV